jgi:hypothetical protein
MMQYIETELARAETEECIQYCEEAYRVCSETLTYCLQVGGKYMEPEHLRLLHYCIQICRASADFMRRGSPFHGLTCGICAMICERCMNDCLSMDEDDPQMRACAQVCRRCMESCRYMASVMAN